MLALVGPLLVCPAARGAPAEATPQPPTTLTVVMHDLRGRTVGHVTLTDSPHGLLIRGTLRNLPRGTHALHFHETGKCEPPFKSAGAHYNPTQKSHGVLDPAGHHAGDLPNLVVPKSGKLDFETFALGRPASSMPTGRHSCSMRRRTTITPSRPAMPATASPAPRFPAERRSRLLRPTALSSSGRHGTVGACGSSIARRSPGV